jgi:hypothetical protein
MPGEDFHLPSQTRFQAHYPPQSGWLGEWDRLKGGRPNGLSVALKRALVHESRSGRWVPSAFSCSRMYWRTCSSSKPTVDTA